MKLRSITISAFFLSLVFAPGKTSAVSVIPWTKIPLGPVFLLAEAEHQSNTLLGGLQQKHIEWSSFETLHYAITDPPIEGYNLNPSQLRAATILTKRLQQVFGESLIAKEMEGPIADALSKETPTKIFGGGKQIYFPLVPRAYAKELVMAQEARSRQQGTQQTSEPKLTYVPAAELINQVLGTAKPVDDHTKEVFEALSSSAELAIHTAYEEGKFEELLAKTPSSSDSPALWDIPANDTLHAKDERTPFLGQMPRLGEIPVLEL